MTWVKICGITNLEDALVAVEAGADALGFVFYEKSPRRIQPDQVRGISDALPRYIEKLGVFVDKPEKEMDAVTDEAGLMGWQLHKQIGRTPLKENEFIVLPKQSSESKTTYISLPADAFVDEHGYRGFAYPEGAEKALTALFIDSGRGDTPGGTGKAFDWHALEIAIHCLSLKFNIVVAGGLTADNVGEAIRVLHPWGVDVSSGVEARPGKKDPEKVRAFIKAVREADKANSRN